MFIYIHIYTNISQLVDRLTQHLSKTHGGQRQLKRETMLRLLHKCDWQLTTAANLAGHPLFTNTLSPSPYPDGMGQRCIAAR